MSFQFKPQVRLVVQARQLRRKMLDSVCSCPLLTFYLERELERVEALPYTTLQEKERLLIVIQELTGMLMRTRNVCQTPLCSVYRLYMEKLADMQMQCEKLLRLEKDMTAYGKDHLLTNVDTLECWESYLQEKEKVEDGVRPLYDTLFH